MNKSPWRTFAIAAVAIIAGYFLTRLFDLTLIPIFTDEAIYIRWSQIGANDPNWRFISLVDGKQPLFTWIMMVLFKLLHGVDPLVIGRLVSVLAGALSLVGITALTRLLLGSWRTALVAAGLYVIFPFALMYDRLALYDSLVAALFISNTFFSVLFARKPDLRNALLLGMSLGLSMLNKSSGFLSLYFLPLTLLVLDWSSKGRRLRLLRYFGFALVAAVLSQAIYAILRLSPLYHMIGLKNTVFLYTFSQWIMSPFAFVYGNLRALVEWTITYMTWPLFIAAFLPFVTIPGKRRELLMLYGYWAGPLVSLAFFGKVLYPRFILFMAMPLVIASAMTFEQVLFRLRNQRLKSIVALVLIVPLVLSSYMILVDPARAPIPRADTGQLINDWPAGGGIPESVRFISEQRDQGKVTVFTDGTFGLLPYALEIYFPGDPNVDIRGIWPVPDDMPAEASEAASLGRTYLILNSQEYEPPGWSLELISRHQKGIREDRSLRLYRVLQGEE